jgi:hypothetical protein
VPKRDKAIQWRVTFIDPVTADRIELDVCAPDIVAARERGWAALRATRPPGLVVVELIDARPADARDRVLPKEADDERDQGVHPSGRDQ